MARGLRLSMALGLLGVSTEAAVATSGRFRGSRSATRRGSSFVGFNYENHGGDWHMGQCASRERQSPIDFGLAAPWVAPPELSFFYNYEPLQGSWEVRNTGTAIAADLDGKGLGGIEYKNERFSLSSISFHLHSEHTFHGRAVPLEAHIVHKSEESDDHVLIMAVPFVVSEPPPTYTYLGMGHCMFGYYAGWNPADAVSYEACVNKCNSEPHCEYFAFSGNRTCSRYTTAAGLCDPLQVDTMQVALAEHTYKKVLPPKNFVLLGSGHCPGFTVETPADGAAACQSQCSLSPLCAFASYSQAKRCMLFNATEGPCNNRTAGMLDFVTYQKRDASISVALEGLLDLSKSLPEPGKAHIRAPPLPLDIVGDFVSGGTFFQYSGSLTAPPCTEGVTWFVRREAATFSCDQQAQMVDAILKMTSDIGNYRAIMPLMGRRIGVVAAASGIPAKAPPPPHVPGMPIAVQSKANLWAAEAQQWAWHAQDLAGNISRTMQSMPSPGMGPMPPFLPPMPPGAAVSGPAPLMMAPPGGPVARMSPLPASMPVAGLLSLRRPAVTSWGAGSAVGVLASEAELDASRSFDIGRQLAGELAAEPESEGPSLGA